MAKKAVEYGVLVAPIGTVDNEKSMTKATFFATLEQQYPSAAGWKVVERAITPVPGGDTIVMAYHVEKVNE
jgi:hypothetical protein